MERWGGNGNICENDRDRAGRRARRSLAVVGAAVLMLSTGCGVLTGPVTATPTATRTAEQMGPRVVLTVGGPSGPTATPGVAPTIPDSTPRPRYELPSRDAVSAGEPAPTATSRPAVSAAARAAQPPPAPIPVAPRAATSPVARP